MQVSDFMFFQDDQDTTGRQYKIINYHQNDKPNH